MADTASMEQFIAQNGVEGIPHIPDADGSLWQQFGVRQQHTYVFINDDGTARISGYGNLQADVEGLIAS